MTRSSPGPTFTEDLTPAPAPRVVNDLPPFKANAEIYNGDRSQPLLAIALIVDASDQNLLDELLLLPGPLSIIVPSRDGDVSSAVLDARDAGFEAMIGVDAAGAAEIAVKAGLSPYVIGVALLGEEASTNSVADAVVPELEQRGMALLDASADGGAAPFRVARSNGVPAAANGRFFDTVQSSAMVFQSLERAAFDARRTGAFVVMATADSAVLTGLRRWMNVKADKSVNVAPLSVVIDKVARQ